MEQQALILIKSQVSELNSHQFSENNSEGLDYLASFTSANFRNGAQVMTPHTHGLTDQPLSIPSMRSFAVCITALLAIYCAPVLADTSPSHWCSRPYDRTSEYAVTAYRNCIESFVDEQQDAIKRHASAAEAAIDDWNSFARGY